MSGDENPPFIPFPPISNAFPPFPPGIRGLPPGKPGFNGAIPLPLILFVYPFTFSGGLNVKSAPSSYAETPVTNMQRTNNNIRPIPTEFFIFPPPYH